MCGICGFYSKSLSRFDNTIIEMNSAIYHRGPDDNGVWQDLNSGIVLGQQRLSIIDLSAAGHQPMHSRSGRYVLIYNGEIYNHLDIRKEIEQSNNQIIWIGKSDTETLLEAIENWGIELTLKKLVGMFAFTVWDRKNHELTLARDRMGEKPLYFGWQGKGNNRVFLFASELKALKAHPEFNNEINRDALALHLRHGNIPAPYSIYRNIHKLLPGNYLQLTRNDLEAGLISASKTYWSLTDVAVSGNNNLLSLSHDDILEELENRISSSIKQQMISDVPLGAFLSGGIDSSTIVALMQSQSALPIKTFTIGFAEGNYNEAKYAKEVARYLGTDHTEMYVSSEQAMSVIPKLPAIYDEPFADSSQIPTFLVSQLAKDKVTVSLSGDGGDELFCGYNRYTMSSNLWNKIRLMPAPIRKLLAKGIESVSPQSWNTLSKYIPGRYGQYVDFGDKMHKGAKVLDCSNLSELYYRLTSYWQLPGEIVINGNEPGTFLTQNKPNLPGLDSQQQMMALDSITYLPDDILVKVDRAAMATSLETRVPFLDHRLIEYIWRIPQSLKLNQGKGKWVLRQILHKHVPKELIERPKMGFGIPIDSWLRGPLKEWASNQLDETRLRQEGYLNPELILKRWNEHLSGRRNWKDSLWSILMFQAWLETHNSK